jgi:hypothetical protein
MIIEIQTFFARFDLYFDNSAHLNPFFLKHISHKITIFSCFFSIGYALRKQ